MSENFQMSYLLKVNIAVDQGIEIKTRLNYFLFFVLTEKYFFLFEGGATLPYVGMVCWDLLVSLGGLGPYPSSRGKT